MTKSISFKQFWELAEVYTAPLNLFIILLGVSAASFLTDQHLTWQVFLYTAVLIAFHLATNIFNNYMDYKNANDESYKTKTNIIGRDKLTLASVKRLFNIWMGLSLIFGVVLVFNSNWLVGVLGAIGFYIGLFYSFGKYPLNSLPIAETITSIASGFFISVISFYLVLVHYPDWSAGMVGKMLLISLPLVIAMFNNLLANNTCDLEEDINNNRHTLVYYIGKKSAVRLLKIVFYSIFILLPLLVWLNLAPISVLALFFVLPMSIKNLQYYTQLQDKQKTFPLILKTMSVVMVGYPLLYFVGIWFN